MGLPYRIIPRMAGGLAEEWVALGVEHHTAGRLDQAERAYRQGLRVDPNHAACAANLGLVGVLRGQFAQARQDLERAYFQAQNLWLVSYNLGLVLFEVGELIEAQHALTLSLKTKDTSEAHAARGLVWGQLGDPDKAAEDYAAAIALDPNAEFPALQAAFHTSLLDVTPKESLDMRRRWHEQHRWRGTPAPHRNDRDPDRPLKVGYVSGDYRHHSAPSVFGAVVLYHDPQQVTPILYSTIPHDDSDPVTQKFKTGATWRDIFGMDDDKAEKLIREDAIDILVDLSGHTGGHRLPLFTRKPAPIQVTAWGFAHGTGCPEIDYFFADRVTVPFEEEVHFAESVYRLPCLVAYDPPTVYTLTGYSPPPCERTGVITFGVYARSEKWSPAAMAAWRTILERVPDSRLIIKDNALRRADTLLRVWKQLGVDRARILPGLETDHREHLLAYQDADLILDPFPHSGGVAALEQLYMSVPLVTLHGRQIGGRLASTILQTIGRPELIAGSIEEYIDLAVSLAKDRAYLAEARKTLRPALLASPIADGSYVRSVEAAYRAMWKRWLA